MKIAIYTLCYNETFMLPFFFEHYRPLVDRIIINDNESTDNSRELAKSLGADEVRTFSTNNEINDDITAKLRNMCWKELRGQGYDWVFILDMDEFIYHPKLRDYLTQKRAEGKTIIVPQGCQMIGDRVPVHGKPLFQQIYKGTFTFEYSKPIIFNPDEVTETCFCHGAHAMCSPVGNINPDFTGEVRLLHYHWLSLDWVVERNKWRSVRRSSLNRHHGWGHRYAYSYEETKREYIEIKRKAFNVFAPRRHTARHNNRLLQERRERVR